jgi:alpha-tubulin suppressor-like RCC1 family protein
MSAGFYHVVAIDASGALWVWGINYDANIGAASPLSPGMRRPELSMMQVDPIRLDLGARFVSASANQRPSLTPNYVKQFSVAVDDSGRLWTWGNGWYGTLVTGKKRRSSATPAPRLIGTPPLVEVAAGAHHVVALDEHGDFWTWGAAEIADARGFLLGTGGSSGTFIPVHVPLI